MSARHERRNRAFWDADADDYQVAHRADLTGDRARAWGAFRIPEAELGVLGPVAGSELLEYGCGAAQWSIALSEDGAALVALDQSRAQLRHARRLQQEHGVTFPLVVASGEATPFRDAHFDLVFCDHGAMSFCDPSASVPEVARLVRPGGRVVFCHTTAWLELTYDEDRQRQDRRLHADYFGMRRFDRGEGTIDFQLPYGEWVRLFRGHGLTVEDLVELRPPDDATTTYDLVPRRWARRWPAEQIWVLRRS